MSKRRQLELEGNEEESSGLSGEDDSSLTQVLSVEWPNVALDPDTFGITICCMVRDFYLLAKHKGTRINRFSRLATTFSLLITCLTIQVFLLSQVKRFVSAKAVHDVRIAYDMFERHMYDNHTFVLSETPFPELRGEGGINGQYFKPENFNTLSADDQASACRIPLSQPLFFFAVLYIWTLTCVAEVRKCKDLFESLIVQTQHCESMGESLIAEDDELGGAWVIEKLTTRMKVALTTIVLLPRLVITLYLVWIGCRWLLATNNFSDLILNSVALEFILCLKDVLYVAIVPRRSMIDLENTNIKPTTTREPESLTVFVGTVAWAALSAAWVLVYMGFPGVNGIQQVLINYQWDVHEVCTEWIGHRYAI